MTINGIGRDRAGSSGIERDRAGSSGIERDRAGSSGIERNRAESPGAAYGARWVPAARPAALQHRITVSIQMTALLAVSAVTALSACWHSISACLRPLLVPASPS